MKKKLIALALSALMVTGLVGCGSSSEGSGEGAETSLKVGMVTDSGTIDDKSFNQGTWEGIVQAEADLGIDTNYLQPGGETEADYLTEIANLYDTGYEFIVTPGFKFETAIHKAQNEYPEGKFVIIDGNPHNGDFVADVADNTVSIFFAEEQSGFAAGVAAAIELQEAAFGFIGGMELPAVQKFNWGFQQGVAYANENYGTKITLEEENIVYEGTFTNIAGGQQLAATMYDRGVEVIFAAAGGVGVGVMNEAKNRAVNGEEVWVIGVDVDQYSEGIYEGEKSIVLTSAMKEIDLAAYNMIEAELEGEFPGGETLVYDASNDGVGLPDENPNLSEEAVAKAEEVLGLMKDGTIEVSNEQGDLIK